MTEHSHLPAGPDDLGTAPAGSPRTGSPGSPAVPRLVVRTTRLPDGLPAA
ncbi:hypothetical protein H9652_14910, partial [Oerskovia sp. Sa4CUA1]|nr:hypothetical protein [Oerskovia rustica]